MLELTLLLKNTTGLLKWAKAQRSGVKPLTHPLPHPLPPPPPRTTAEVLIGNDPGRVCGPT